MNAEILDILAPSEAQSGVLTTQLPIPIAGLNLPPIRAIERGFGVFVLLPEEVRHA